MHKWEDHFYYDETSPSCLRWRNNRMRGKHLNVVFIEKDSPAGGIDNKGYWVVNIDKKQVFVHRIIIEMHGTNCSGLFVDHIDRDRSNNKISNLRVVDRSVNNRNHPKRRDNTSGITGVTFIGNRWVAQWMAIDRKQHAKSFSVNKYGYGAAFNLARSFRDNKIQELNNEGFEYSDEHGK